MKILALIVFLSLIPDFLYSAYMTHIIGNVYYKTENADKWIKADNKKDKIEIEPATEITTERASSVEIYMDNGSKLKIAPMSYFKFEKEDGEEIKGSLFMGKIRNWVKKFSKKYLIKTSNAVCGVRGTDFVVNYDINGNTRVEVFDGAVDVSDSKGRSFLVNKGKFIEVRGDTIMLPKSNPNPEPTLDSNITDPKILAKKEIYTEISKEEVIKRAQQELQMAEYQNRKTAVDAFGYRVRMEEYVVRPQPNQFKYVVLNTRENRFDFGKILFTFNDTLPEDLTLATKNMMTYYGSTAPSLYLTDINSVMSNTVDKVTEEATGGKMVPDDPLNPTKWTHFFKSYSFYAAGKSEGNENGGKGRLLWSVVDSNLNDKYDRGEFTYWGGSKPGAISSNPDGDDILHNYAKNTYSDGTWISVDDYVVFDDGKVASLNDFHLKPDEDVDSFVDKLNFERVYKSSMFSDKIDLVFSAKLLKDIGLLTLK